MRGGAGRRQAISSRKVLESLRLSLSRATKVNPLVALRYDRHERGKQTTHRRDAENAEKNQGILSAPCASAVNPPPQ